MYILFCFTASRYSDHKNNAHTHKRSLFYFVIAHADTPVLGGGVGVGRRGSVGRRGRLVVLRNELEKWCALLAPPPRLQRKGLYFNVKLMIGPSVLILKNLCRHVLRF